MRYNRDSLAIELSARELCLVALRHGDLDGIPLRALELPRDDKELFYRLQSEAGAYYNPDMELCYTLEHGGIYYTATAIADGVVRKGGKTTVDKIRCVKGRAFYSQPDELTLGLLKCSALFLAVRDGLEVIDGRVSYYNIDTKKLKYFKYTFLVSELKRFYLDMIERIAFRAEIIATRDSTELDAARDARFPYSELREGQETMIRECYSAIKRGKRIFIEAPTGTGKTISALFPAVRALGAGYCDKIFYLTPKASTRHEAFMAAARLHTSGAGLRTVVLSAKEHMCAGGGCRGHGSRDCQNSCGYYDRVDAALREMLDKYRGYPRSLIIETAKKYGVCPYELSLDLSELCDIIICDYNYAFDPHVYLRRYFGAEGAERGERYVFLVDEAHDLADRARAMYSAEIRLSTLERALEAVRADVSVDRNIAKALTLATGALGSLRGLCRDQLVKDAEGNESGFYMGSEPPDSITEALAAVSSVCDAWTRKNEGHPLALMLANTSSLTKKYITVTEYFDRSFRFYVQMWGGDLTVSLYCLDPSEVMDALLRRAVSTVMFSATLTPTEYFRDLLGGGKNAEGLTLPSPFAPESLCVAVADYADARLESREKSAMRFTKIIAATVKQRLGNYIAYFPSYQCLEQTYEVFRERFPHVQTVVQTRNMSVTERESFLSAFKDDVGHLRVGFCVLGGSFAEGVDLPGSRLIGTIIFGVGLPGLSNERNMIKEYFDLKDEEIQGYDYAYTFPGMNNVLQAAGRVIRTAQDRGVVVLADDRYATPKYRALFPEHWKGVQYAGNASSLAEIIRRFWEKQ